MLNKRELMYMTVYQLAGLIKEEYREKNNMPDQLSALLSSLSMVDEVTSPEQAHTFARVMEALQVMLKEWEGPEARIVNWEIDRRQKEYARYASNADETPIKLNIKFSFDCAPGSKAEVG